MKIRATNIIPTLTKEEQEVVQFYLDKIEPIGLNKGKVYKGKQLFELLNNQSNTTLDKKKLNTEVEFNRIDMLKVDLLKKITEAIIFDKHINNRKIFGKHDSIIFNLKKEMLAIRVLYRNITKNKSEALFSWLDVLIQKAIQNEVYDVVIEALLLKKYAISLRKGIKEFDKTNIEIEHFRYCNIALYKATDDYTKLILNNEFLKIYTQQELTSQINLAINRISIDYKITKSLQINYYLQILILANFEKKKAYKNAILQCKKIILLLKKNQLIFREERIGFALDHLSQYLVYTSQYKKAAISAAKAQTHYIENSFFSIISKEQEFYAHFYDSNYNKANSCVNILLNHPLADSGEFRKSKFIYYKACILFQLKEYESAWKILKNNLEIEKDRSRWNISLRVLCIQLFIELKKLDEATRSIDALRKHIYRQLKKSNISERDLIILNCLKELDKTGYNLNQKNIRLKMFAKELSEKNTASSWEHYSHELVKFHIWISEKLIIKTPRHS